MIPDEYRLYGGGKDDDETQIKNYYIIFGRKQKYAAIVPFGIPWDVVLDWLHSHTANEEVKALKSSSFVNQTRNEGRVIYSVAWQGR